MLNNTLTIKNAFSFLVNEKFKVHSENIIDLNAVKSEAEQPESSSGTGKFDDIMKCQLSLIRCACTSLNEAVNCEICSDKKEISSSKLNDIMKEIVESKYKGDQVWMVNAFAHVVWKMAAYGLHLKKD